ncbi:MAG: VCBS repeat-containing protein, partial [Chloroherpetonaceae bacterium]|nr:VCBS repeat-containing protein [Chloroherpetonaceae bacterium]
MADVNLDGKPDFVTANSGSGTVSVRLGQGNGSFTFPSTPEVSVGSGPFDVFVADVNLDGKPDLLTANIGSNTVSVRLGQGDGTFTSPPTPEVTVGNSPRSVFVADVNLDGKPDLLAANASSGTVSVRLGQGNGTFASPPTPEVSVGSGPFDVFVADVNLDGKPDLVAANVGSGTVAVRLGQGDGSFTGAPDISIGGSPQSVFVADVNLDGKPDLLTANSGSGTVSVRLGQGNGSFTGSTNIGVSGAVDVFVADVNLDGKPDFVTANGGNDLSVRLGDGTGNFTGSTSLLVGIGPRSVFVADVNLDGKPDLLSADEFSGTVSVLLNATPVAVNFLGVVGNVSVDPEPVSIFVADVNLDGKPDFVTANQSFGTVSVRLGQGDGGFTGTANIIVGSGPVDAFVADVNLDGKPDLLTANFNGNNVSVRLGQGNGTFTSPPTPEVSVGSFPRSVFVADVNLDGKPDLLTANSNGNDVSVRLGQGDGTFISPSTPEIGVSSNPYSVFVADVNLDGKPDLLAANSSSGTVSVRLGDGTGYFSPSTEVNVGSSPRNVFVADVNLDGKPDLLVNNEFSNTVSVRLGQGDGTFTSPSIPEVSVGSFPRDIFVADVNLDGKPDFVTANYADGNMSVRLGDGTGNFTTTPDINVLGFPFSVFVADVNLDGKPDLLASNSISNEVSVALNNLPDYSGSVSGITPSAYRNVTFSGSGNLPGNITVAGTLTLFLGAIVNLNGNAITVTNGSSLAIQGTGFLTGSGSLVRAFVGNQDYKFPYRQGGNDRSATVQFGTFTGTGTLTFQFFNSPPGNAGLPLTILGQTIDATAPYFWRIDASGSPGTYTLSLRAQNTGGISNVSTLRIVKRPNGGNWSATGIGTGNANAGTPADPTIVQSGMTGFSEFTIGGNSAQNQ